MGSKRRQLNENGPVDLPGTSTRQRATRTPTPRGRTPRGRTPRGCRRRLAVQQLRDAASRCTTEIDKRCGRLAEAGRGPQTPAIRRGHSSYPASQGRHKRESQSSCHRTRATRSGDLGGHSSRRDGFALGAPCPPACPPACPSRCTARFRAADDPTGSLLLRCFGGCVHDHEVGPQREPRAMLSDARMPFS